MGEDGNDGYREMYDKARTNMQNYLWDSMMPYDVSRARTLGFINAEGSTERSFPGLRWSAWISTASPTAT